jgi:hypothetical protein
MPRRVDDDPRWAKVDEIWAEYQRTHDLTGMERKAVGVDPDTGEVFIGDSAIDIGARLEQEGRFRPLYYRRVSSPYYTRHGHGRRVH